MLEFFSRSWEISPCFSPILWSAILHDISDYVELRITPDDGNGATSWFDIWHRRWRFRRGLHVFDLLTITIVLGRMSHALRWNGIWSSAVILLLLPLAFCNLLQCLCSLSHFNITVLLQFELQDKVLFHFVGLSYCVARVSRYLLCFVLSMNYLEASKIENGLQDVCVLSLSAISVRCLIWSASVE